MLEIAPARSNLTRATRTGALLVFSRSAIYWFCVGFAILTFADLGSILTISDLSVPIKYAYAAVVLALICLYFLKWREIDTVSIAPLFALFFFSVAGATFLLNLILYGQKTSYASAFISPLVFATAAFIPRHSIVFDARKIARGITLLLALAAVGYMLQTVLWSSDLGRDYLGEFAAVGAITEPTKSIVCVLSLCCGIIMGRKALACALAVVAVVALVNRPSSTLAIGFVACVPLAIALRFRRIILSRAMVHAVVLFGSVGPLILYFFFDQAADAVNAIESYIKVHVLGGESNTLVRLAILRYAFQGLDHSFLYGNALNGDINVLLAREYIWWLQISQDGMAVIHSDFVIVLTQAGIIGYLLFVTFIYSVVNARFRMMSRIRRYDERSDLVAISIVAIVALVIYASFNPFLMLYHCAHPVWMLLLVSEIAGKAGTVLVNPANRVEKRLGRKFQFALS